MFQNLRICTRIAPTAGHSRSVSTTATCFGRRNFRKFPIINKRGVWEHAKMPKLIMERFFNYPVTMDKTRTQYPGVYFGKQFVYVKEMEPELIVPDDFESSTLKPYVSYRTEEIEQSAFTAQQLFNATYGKDIVIKHRANEPIPESLTEFSEFDAVKAKEKALSCGADLFDHTSTFGGLDNEYKIK